MITTSDITEMVRSGKLTHKQGIDLYSVLYGQTLEPLELPCEHCGKTLAFGDMVSYKIWIPFPGHKKVPGYDEHDQHFACSHDCAEELVKKCVHEHLRPEAESRIEKAKNKSE